MNRAQMDHRDHRLPVRPNGFTLVELLVALAVLTILGAIALPATKTMIKEQRVSRGAGLLQSAIQEARARAIVDGGGGGLVIDRLSDRSLAGRSEAVRIRFVTSPPAYRGEPGAELPYFGRTVYTLPSGQTIAAATLWFDPYASVVLRSAQDYGQGNVPTLINEGDVISVGEAELPMRILYINRNEQGVLGPDGLPPPYAPDAAQLANDFAGVPANNQPTGTNNWTRLVLELPERNLDVRRHVGTQVTFAIQRQFRPSIAQPIDLPNGVSIDLTSSGVGRFGNQFSPMNVGIGTGVNYLDTTLPPFANPPANTSGIMDYGSVAILFNTRGEVSRAVAATGLQSVTNPSTGLVEQRPVYSDIPLLGDVFLLVTEAGQVKTDPEGQLEDSDANPLQDQADDGTTPLLNPESIWVVVRSRTGEVVSSPWINPVADGDPLIPPITGTLDDAQQQRRVQGLLSLTRSAATRQSEVASQ